MTNQPTLFEPLSLAATGFVLVSWWKPLLILIVLVPWAWVISKIYDKHTARFFLPRRKWNIFHMLMGLVAFFASIMMGSVVSGEGGFWAGWGAMIAILMIDLAAYAMIANKDSRVPEAFKIKLNMESLAEKKEAKKIAKAQGKVSLAIKGQDEKGKFSVTVAPPQSETPEYEVRVAAEALYTAAIAARASQVDIGPTGKDNNYSVSYLVDGMRQQAETMPAPNAGRMMDFWKAAAKLDVADRRRKLVGAVAVEAGVIRHTARIISIGVQGGMRLTMLFDPEQAVTRKTSELGLLEAQMAELKTIVQEGKGVVLLTAPPDSGRTTTMYAITRMHDAYTSNVQTVEIDPQSNIEGVRSNKWEPSADAAGGEGGGGEFSTLVRSILRRDPDVVAVSEMPDPNTAKEIARADHDRTRIYLCYRGNDSLTSVQAYVKAVGDPKQAADSLHGVICEKLVRKLCHNCRVPYPPGADLLKKLGIPEGKVQQLFKKGGQVLIKNKPEVCPVCSGAGYQGQEGIFEVFSIGPEERTLIIEGNWPGLRAAFRKKQLPTIQQVAIRKAVDGITSIEEVTRVTTGEQSAAAAASAPSGNGARPAAAPAAKPKA